MRSIVLSTVVAVCVGCGATPQDAARKQWLTACDTAALTLAELAPYVQKMTDKQRVTVNVYREEINRICLAKDPPRSLAALNVAIGNLNAVKEEAS